MLKHQHAPTLASSVLRALRWLSTSTALASLVACGGNGTTGTGTLRMALTDAPACGYDHVYVTVDRVRVHQSVNAVDSDAGWSEIIIPGIAAERRLDLLNLTNGVLQELGQTPLPAGSYEQIRLVLADNPSNPTPPSNPLANALVLSTDPWKTEIPLKTPSGQQSGIKLQAHFVVPAGQLADLVLDFDACKSVVKAGSSGNYNLKPVMSVFRRLTAQIVGFVHKDLAIPDTVVSAQLNGQTVRSTVPAADGKFTIAWLPENASYTVVVTSEGLPSGVGWSTAVVTGVPVSVATGTTPLNPVTDPILPGSSQMAAVGGTVSASPATDAVVTVRATQMLTSGPIIEVASRPVDGMGGTYGMNLPLAGPVRASYDNGAALTFGLPDAIAAGRYTLEAATPGYATQNTTLMVTGPATQDFTLPQAP